MYGYLGLFLIPNSKKIQNQGIFYKMKLVSPNIYK